MTYSTPYKLLYYLSNDQWVTGPVLAEMIGVSRAAIWKQIKHLQSEGIEIEQSHRGYRLTNPLILLDEDFIRADIESRKLPKNIQLTIHPTIDSTNKYVKQQVKHSDWAICLSEQQTAGRGRLGRTWSSPFGENMYLSIAWRTTGSLAKLSGLSIAASLALKRALSPWIEDIQVKWPNDLIWHGKKLAGCLVEISAESHGNCFVIVGIGLNINTQTNINPLSSQPHCSLRDILNQNLNRNDIITATLNSCLDIFPDFEQNGLLPELGAWKDADYLYNRHIKIYQPNRSTEGTAKGINSLGHLLLEKEDGTIEEISSGEASLNQPI